jgi:DNA-binding transcriptional LysR family regulator
MNLRDLQAFVAVVETGSLVAASMRLHLTQPGVTRRIQNLESTLGTQLLDRASKPLKPSAAGRDVYTLARQVLHSIDELKTVVAPDAEPAGEFRLGVPPFLSGLILGEPVDRLRQRFPKLALRISAGWSPLMLSQLQANAIDAAVLVTPHDAEPPSGLATSVLRHYETVAVAPAALDLPRGEVALADLAGQPWVLNQDGCGLRAAVTRALRTAGLALEVAVEASDIETQLSLVARGHGIGLVPRLLLEESRWRDRLQLLEVPELGGGVTVLLAHHPEPGRLAEPLELLRSSLRTAAPTDQKR